MIRCAALGLVLLSSFACADSTVDPGDAGSADSAAAADARPGDALPADALTDAGPADATVADATPEDTGPAPVCGNNLEESGEDCDDGNTVDDGNGCSARCQNNASCGNGAVEGLFESCDPGLTACCNSTCDGALGTGAPCRAATGECDVVETCDGTSLDCPADRAQTDGTLCSTCPLGSDCAGCFGGACLDSRSFCADLLDRGQSTGDGVYTVRPAATASVTAATSTMSVFCDMTTDGGGWTMVYKKSRIVRGDGGLLWTRSATNTAILPILNREIASVDYSNAFQVDYWGAFAEARVEVVTGTVTRKFVQFNLVGATPTSWFAADRHTASSWTDLPTNPTFDNGGAQAFRIGGGRSFYINRVWDGCPSDRGWLMISTVDTCYWETRTGDPTDIIYSMLTTESHIPTLTQTGYADTLVIFVR
ncbi:MAG: hypothetical protein IT384_20975 [Deltaproteobacteria bacterium]|nr:hypothetical protein [Deltaproteobacteria bacterium]